MGNVYNGRSCTCVGTGGIEEIFVPFPQFSESKTALKKSLNWKKKRQKDILNTYIQQKTHIWNIERELIQINKKDNWIKNTQNTREMDNSQKANEVSLHIL